MASTIVTVPHLVAAIVAIAGCITDLRTRRIPNALTLGAAAGAFGFYLVGGGLHALGWSAAGWAVGLACFLPLFLLRGLGGGDVKLVAALGAWIGPGAALSLALWTAVAGGPLAIAVALSRRYLGRAFSNLGSLLTFWRVAGMRAHPTINLESGSSPRLPYALPIAAGLAVTLWLR